MSARVLIVERDRLAARELAALLERHGCPVIAEIVEHEEVLPAAAAELPEVVVMDVRLAGERDGIELAQLLQQRFDVPVVFLTADSDAATVARAKECGAAFLLKPPNERELLIAIELALHQHVRTRDLRAREKLLRQTLEAIGEAVIAADTTGAVAYANHAAEQLTGWHIAEVLGRPLSSVANLIYDHAPGETVLTDRTGRRRGVVETASSLLDDDGSVVGGVLVLRDVTVQRAREQRREAADRLASLTTLAAGVARQLEPPLTAIDEYFAGTPMPGLAEAAARLRAIARDLEACVARGADRESCHVAAAVAVATSRIDVDVDVDSSLGAAIGQATLVDVLQRVLANAVEAGAPRIELVARGTSDATLAIEIVDTGPGMDGWALARAVEPYFTTKPGHSGLGLAISHGLIAAAGGSLELASTPGRTMVRIRLPRHADD